jgi:hypothetical protein
MKLLLVTLGIISCLVMSNIANAQSTLALQEKCAKWAEEQFVKTYGESPRQGYWKSSKPDKDGAYYFFILESHYNKKRDRCFMFIQEDHLGKDNRVIEFRVEYLYDAYEGKEYCQCMLSWDKKKIDWKPNTGGFCHIGDRYPSSYDEWKQLIKPYMEE